MGRPPLEIGTAGEISYSGVKPKVRARCRYRGADGITISVERTGATKAKAKTALNAAIKIRKNSGDGVLNGTSTIAELMGAWWAWKRETSKLSAGSEANYADVVNRIIVPGLGKVRLHEATTGRMDDWLIGERRKRVGQAEIARTLLNQAFAFAAQRDAVSGNPISDVSKPKRVTPAPRALTVTELETLRDAVRGMRQNTWLADLFETQLVVAGRIGEVLALKTENLDLDHLDDDGQPEPQVQIVATVITPTGVKHSRQLHTKDGIDGKRTVTVPDWVAAILRNRALLAGPSGLVFATRNDTLLDPHNVRESWRNIRRGAGLGWMTPHHLRKTALSRIAKVFDIETAALFADHKGIAVTERHYIEKVAAVGPDVRSAFTELAPKPHLRLVEKASQ
jgi:integrase